MTVTTADIITQEAIRQAIEDAFEESLIYRRAFRELDATGFANDTVKLPKDDDTMAEPTEIPEKTEFPTTEEDLSTVSATVKKIGNEIPISMEAEADSVFNQASFQVQKQARKMEEKLNSLAHSELSGNLHTNSPAGNQGDTSVLEWEDITDGVRELRASGANPDLFILSPAGEQDLLTSDDFTRATEFSDRVLREGPDVVGRIAGVDVILDNDGLIGNTNAHGFLVDSEAYGWEVMKGGVQTNEYEDDSSQSRRFQHWTRVKHKATKTDAAIKVEP